MTVEDITDDFDTARDPSVPALLWEVRRERRVELMGEGFRLDDLRRWKKGDYVNKRPLGVYVMGASAKNLKVTADRVMTKGMFTSLTLRSDGRNIITCIRCL